MTNVKKILYVMLVIFIVMSALSVPVYADHGRGGHARIGIWFGGPLWWGSWWGSYPYYASPPVVIQQQAPVYEESAPPVQEQPYYWYFCADSKAYYPYVKECPGGWMKVVPPPAK